MTDQYQIPLDRTANVPVTEGIHTFAVSEIVEGESKSQNPMWTVTLSCLDEAEAGKEVRLFLVLTESARWKLEDFLDAVGAPKQGSATASQFIGRKLRCQITHEDYEGRPQPRVGEMWPMTTNPATIKPSTAKPVATKVEAPISKPVAAKPVAAAVAPRRAAARPKDVAEESAE